MDSLIKRLKEEVGLTDEQAESVIKCVRNYMSDNDLDIDWEDFLKSKTKKITDAAKEKYNELTGKNSNFGDKVNDWADKAQDTLEDLSDKAQHKLDELSAKTKQNIKDARNKAADYLADKD